MQCLVQFICMICTYIYRYIYKVASKNGFLICNACSHSHSPTLHLFQRYSLFFCLSLSFYYALFSFLLSLYSNAFSKTKGLRFLFFKGSFQGVVRRQLTLLAGASSATAPPTCCAIADARSCIRGSKRLRCVLPDIAT